MLVKSNFLNSLFLPLSWPPFLIRLALGLVFIYAGTVKLSAHRAFARIISRRIVFK